MDVERVLNTPSQLRGTTGLDRDEFEALEAPFEAEFKKRVCKRTERGRRRVRAPGAGSKGPLSETRVQLYFILFYFKVYPAQEVMGAVFGLGQPEVCRWIQRLSPVLEAALKRKKALPAQNGNALARAMAACPCKVFVLDGTERAIRRPNGEQRQKKTYSGKKKRHTVKNLVVANGKRYWA